MRQLFWKEWRENRLIAVVAPAMTLCLLIGISVTCLHTNLIGEQGHVDAIALSGSVMLAWFLSAIMCSSVLVAPEIGSGTLQFLTALPITRKRIWWTKLSVGMGVLAISFVSSGIIYVIFNLLAVHFKLLVKPPQGMIIDPNFVLVLVVGASAVLPLFSVGAIITMLTDRTITSLMISILTAVIVAVLIEAIAGMAGSSQTIVFCCLTGLMTVLLFSMSYCVFTRGETLLTSKRFKLMLTALWFLLSRTALPILIIGAALVAAYYIVVW